MLGFQAPLCRFSGPRHGKENRLCLITRERMHRSLLLRVVRTRQDGKYKVVIGDAEGRSAYVKKDPEVVAQLSKKKKLGRALRCAVPSEIFEELQRSAEDFQRLPESRKGMSYCEAFALDGAYSAVDEVQNPCYCELG